MFLITFVIILPIILYLQPMVADLCHVVLSCFWSEKAKTRHAKTCQMVTFSCFRMATFRPATRTYDTFYASPFPRLFVVSLPGGAKGRHAKTRQNHHLACFRVATFRPARQRYDKQGRKRERSPRENPPNGDFVVFSHDALWPRHTKVRKIPGVAFLVSVCLIFACRGERSPCENPTKSPFGRFSRGDLFALSSRKHVYTTWHKSATISTRDVMPILNTWMQKRRRNRRHLSSCLIG